MTSGVAPEKPARNSGCAARSCANCSRKRLDGRDDLIGAAKAPEQQIAQAAANGVAHEQRSGQHRHGRGDAEHHGHVRAPVVRQASKDDLSRAHTCASHFTTDILARHPVCLSPRLISSPGIHRRSPAFDANIEPVPAGWRDAARREAEKVALAKLLQDSRKVCDRSRVDSISRTAPPVSSPRSLRNVGTDAAAHRDAIDDDVGSSRRLEHDIR